MTGHTREASLCRRTSPPEMWLASISALRFNAFSILSFTSLALAFGYPFGLCFAAHLEGRSAHVRSGPCERGASMAIDAIRRPRPCLDFARKWWVDCILPRLDVVLFGATVARHCRLPGPEFGVVCVVALGQTDSCAPICRDHCGLARLRPVGHALRPKDHRMGPGRRQPRGNWSADIVVPRRGAPLGCALR